MTDDLVKRLRIGIHTSADEQALRSESADRIEQLEAAYAQQQQVWSDAIARADRYEEALRQICDGPRDADKSYAELFAEVCREARKALEGENDQTDASFTKPEAMVVPCIWDNKQKIYVPVYSHRGVEIQNRIEKLEAAIFSIYVAPNDIPFIKAQIDAVLDVNECRKKWGERNDQP